MIVRSLLLSCVGYLVLGGSSARAEDLRLIARGRAVAEAGCSACHEVGAHGQSPNDQAPPFRRLHEEYPVADLIAALSEGAEPSHAGMRRFRLAPRDAKALTAYIHSLER